MKFLTKIVSSALVGFSFFTQGCMLSNLPYIYKKSETIETVPIYNEDITPEKINLFLTARDDSNFISADKTLCSYILKKTNQGNLKVVKWNSRNEKINDIIIYLNGIESNCGWFSQVASQLAERGIETHALDRRGSGINMKIRGTGEDWLDDIDKLVEKIRNENQQAKIHVVSLCFGARLATSYALQNSSKLSSLIYISPGIETKVEPDCLEKMTTGLAIMFNNPCILIDSPIKDINLFSSEPKIIDEIREDRLRIIAPRAIDLFYGDLLSEKIRKTKKDTGLHSLILYSQNDEISDAPKNIKILMKFFPLIEYKNFSDCQHILPLEAPERVSQDIADWLRRY